jgi:hypothetical protein
MAGSDFLQSYLEHLSGLGLANHRVLAEVWSLRGKIGFNLRVRFAPNVEPMDALLTSVPDFEYQDPACDAFRTFLDALMVRLE